MQYQNEKEGMGGSFPLPKEEDFHRIISDLRDFRAYMDKFRFNDPEAKETVRQLKYYLSTAITYLLVLRNQIDVRPNGWKRFPESLGDSLLQVVAKATDLVAITKARYQDMLEEHFPDEIERLKKFN